MRGAYVTYYIGTHTNTLLYTDILVAYVKYVLSSC